MKPANPHILRINRGSSGIKFALFEAGDSLRRILEGGIERIELKQHLKDTLIERKQYINKNGEDLPEIRNWKWSNHK